jgi:hypothetical protein
VQFTHGNDGPVADEIQKELDWLFEGDRSWSPEP